MAAGLIDDLQPAFGRRDHDAGRGVHMDDAVEVGAGFEDAAVEIVAGGRELDAVVAQHFAVEIDGDEIGGGDLIPAEPERVHQEAVGMIGQPGGDVVVDLLVPAVVVGDPERRGELDPQIALGGADFIAALGLELRLGDHVHASSPDS